MHVSTSRNSFCSTDRLIAEHGIHVFDVIDEDGQPIYWDAIKKGQYDCANILLDYAKNEGMTVTFGGGGEDLLLWAIENAADGVVRFLLEKLTEKYASVEETSELLSKYLYTIGERCPELLADLLRNDEFTIEYARFQVSRTVFDNNKIPKTMITKTIPDNWAEMDGEQGKGLWIEHWGKDPHSIDSTSDAQVMVTAKVFCFNPWVPWKKTNLWPLGLLRQSADLVHVREFISEYFHNLGLPMEVFESKTLMNFIDHMFHAYHPVCQTLIILDAVAALSFTVYSITFEPTDEVEKLRNTRLLILPTASAFLRLHGTFIYRSFERLAITCLFFLWPVSGMDCCRVNTSLIEFALLLVILYDTVGNSNIKLRSLLVSVMCILQWISVFAKSVLPPTESVRAL